MRRGNYQEAIENFNQTIELEKDFAVAYSDRTLAYLQLQDYHQAVTDCTQAINFAPDNFEAYLNRGYEKTLDLLKSLRQQISSVTEIALFY
ncbi:MAG: hypothetical protein V7L20_20545 [Nostoc sp.]|uniref:tetratricopeptide repeat protein n=1 Tax=Nostoc sp. TaxID=1180 RepID=UPI002FF5F070